MSDSENSTTSLTPFNAVDSLTEAFKFVAANALPAFQRHAVLIIAYLAVSIMIALWAREAMLAVFVQSLGRGPDFGDVMSILVFGLISLAIAVVFSAILLMERYQDAAGLQSRGYRFQLGTAEPPILGISEETMTLLSSGVRKIIHMWPALVLVLVLGIAAYFEARAQILSMTGQGSAGLGVLVLLLRAVAIFFGLWTAHAFIKHFLFRTPVIAHQGEADEAAITSVIKTPFPHSVRTG